MCVGVHGYQRVDRKVQGTTRIRKSDRDRDRRHRESEAEPDVPLTEFETELLDAPSRPPEQMDDEQNRHARHEIGDDPVGVIERIEVRRVGRHQYRRPRRRVQRQIRELDERVRRPRERGQTEDDQDLVADGPLRSGELLGSVRRHPPSHARSRPRSHTRGSRPRCRG